MSLVLDPDTEARIQQALATGPFREPAELLALALVEAEREDTPALASRLGGQPQPKDALSVTAATNYLPLHAKRR